MTKILSKGKMSQKFQIKTNMYIELGLGKINQTALHYQKLH